MSASDSGVLARLNQLLAAHPAQDKECGARRFQIRIDNGMVIADVNLAECPREYRFEVPLEKLDVAKLDTEVEAGRGRGQLFVPCRNDESCSSWFIRDDPTSPWRKVRDDPDFVVDMAPDPDAVAQARALMGEWLSSAG